MDWDEASRQKADPDSLFNWVKKALAIRKAQPVLRRGGNQRFLEAGGPHVLAALSEHEGTRLLTLHNLKDSPVKAHNPMARNVEALDLWSGERVFIEKTERVELPAYGFKWLLLT